tara:strand:- start:1016 stop:1732 length:717 start_codon:yes stop_codon:yes gene_type:complete
MIKKIKSSEEYQNLLKKFPKKRPILSQEYKDIYNQHYITNRSGSGFANLLSQKMESWMHKKTSSVIGKDILELGAGNLNHIKYEHSFDNYDVVEPFSNLYKGSTNLSSLRNIFSSLKEVKNKYDKIFSIATCEHLLNLPREIMLCKNLLLPNGTFQVAIPCEGEFAFKFGWMLTTGISFKLKHNLDYSKLMEYEHVNTLSEIYTVLENNFRIVKFKRSPFILPLKNLSFYAYIECRLN